MTPTAAGRALLDAFPRIRIINLEHRDDRRREMVAELARIGIAVDGAQVAFHAASRFDDPAGFRNTGARGCFHSHLSVLADAAAASSSVLLIEDDADFTSGIEALLPQVLAKLQSRDWSIFYGFAGKPGTLENAPTLSKIDPDISVRLAHFVAFSAATIERLVPYLEGMLTRPEGSPDGGPMDVDGAYGWFRSAHPTRATWATAPDLAVQRPSRTDITPGILDQLPGTRQAMSLLRKFKRATQAR